MAWWEDFPDVPRSQKVSLAFFAESSAFFCNILWVIPDRAERGIERFNTIRDIAFSYSKDICSFPDFRVLLTQRTSTSSQSVPTGKVSLAFFAESSASSLYIHWISADREDVLSILCWVFSIESQSKTRKYSTLLIFPYGCNDVGARPFLMGAESPE